MFWISKLAKLVFLSTILFISLVDGLKCLQCESAKCRKGDKNNPPMSITCKPNEYCSKTLYQYYGKNDVERGCYSKQGLEDSELRLNECGEYHNGIGNHKVCICDVDNCNSGYDFPSPPKGLKCLKCTSDDCIFGIENATIISCQKGHYCEKFSYIKNGAKIIKRRCRDPEYLLLHRLKLNDCGLYIVDEDGEQPTCYCNKDSYNSGDNFEPKPKSDTPPIECQTCDGTKCLNGMHGIDICEIGYICYKLFEVESNVSRVVKRGCIHKEYSLDLGIRLNECGQFTNGNNEKQPICVCDQDNCNLGGTLQIKSQEKIEMPCSSSSGAYFNQFFIIFTIFIGFIQILISTNGIFSLNYMIS